MKKCIFVILSVLFTICMLSFCINAAQDYVQPNDRIILSVDSPTVDGNITKTEGWSEPAYMNEDTLLYENKKLPLDIFAEVYFAVDREGFYFAADITENIRAYSPGTVIPEWTDKKMAAGLVYSTYHEVDGYLEDGDCFSLGIDVMDVLREYGMPHSSYRRCPQYNIYIYRDGSLRMFSLYSSQGDYDITDKVKLKGAATDDGWRFEAWLPWSLIREDMQYCAGTEINIPEEIVSDGTLIRAGACYTDMWICSENMQGKLYNRYYTDDGYNISTSWNNGVSNPDNLGIRLIISDICKGRGHKWSDWVVRYRPTYIKEGQQISVCRLCGDYRYKAIPVIEYVNAFTDVREASWYAEGVEYCVKHGYLSGMGNNRFSPNTALTREQCVVILANILNVDFSQYYGIPSGFDDVPVNHWYSGAVTWAAKAGYVKGMNENTFGTGQKIQRAAFARLIYFAAQGLGADMTVRADLTKYVDYDRIPGWAYDQISWAVGSNIIISIKDDILMISPYTELKRAQCATMLWQMGLMLEEQK
ncbi:MAG: S-layer homology domain-containing protein [Clostridia bacterium]|nr:S-layer homology domain-containing protein [Clostridia bacterium]